MTMRWDPHVPRYGPTSPAGPTFLYLYPLQAVGLDPFGIGNGKASPDSQQVGFLGMSNNGMGEVGKYVVYPQVHTVFLIFLFKILHMHVVLEISTHRRLV